MTEITRNGRCTSCDGDCKEPYCIDNHRDPRVTIKYAPKDYASDDFLEESVKDFYMRGFHTSFSDEVRLHCAKMLRLIED